MNQKKGAPRDLLFDTLVIKDEYRKQFVNILKKPQNFFKHADVDSDETVEFDTFSPIPFMMFSILGLRILGDKPSGVVTAFVYWLALHEPRYIKEGGSVELGLSNLTEDALVQVRNIPKVEFLPAFLKAITLKV